jgi:hypothetical protein
VQKLRVLIARAKSSGMINLLKEIQVVEGNVTWCGSWSIVTRLPAVCKSDGEMKWCVEMLALGMQEEEPEHPGLIQRDWKYNPPKLSKDNLLETIQMLLLLRHLLQQIGKECHLGKDHTQRSAVNEFYARLLEVKTFQPARTLPRPPGTPQADTWVAPGQALSMRNQQIATFPEHVQAIIRLMTEFLTGKHDHQLFAIVANSVNSSNITRMTDRRITLILDPVFSSR